MIPLTVLDKEEVEKLLNLNLLSINKHPDLDIYILNYTPKTIYHKLWNSMTLACRGLVIDKDYNIIARSFPKFFNEFELKPEEIPYGEEFDVFKKMDGSLILGFFYNDDWIICSKGSFISDQAILADKILDKSKLSYLDKKYTYTFELVGRDNRIVLDYGENQLILLAAFETQNGFEMLHEDLVQYYNHIFPIVEKININSLDELKSLPDNGNEEGYVIRFLNGFRMKWKFDSYLRLHRIVTNVSSKTIWEYLKNGENFEKMLEHVPDEFYNWVKTTKLDLESKYSQIEKEALLEFVDLYYYGNLVGRKEFAMVAKDNKYRSLLFAIYDHKKYDYIIWNMIKPDYEKPFANGYDGDAET